MATLVIFRGDKRQSEFALSEAPVRIGRSPQNEVVLEDSGKGVSRVHAEIRFEGGQYVLSDNRSQNGVWVDGARVSSVALEPGVVASVGPYRLTVEASDSLNEISSDAPTQIAVRPSLRDEEDQPPPAPEDPTASPAATGARLADPPTNIGSASRHRHTLLASVAVLLVVALGFAVYTLMGPGQRPEEPPSWIAEATALVDRNECSAAMTRFIEPELLRNPGDAAALQLKGRCQPPPPPPEPPAPPLPPVDPSAQLLAEAEALITTGRDSRDLKSCEAAVVKLQEVLPSEASAQRASELAVQAQDCVKRLTVATVNKPVDVPVTRVAAAQGGLTPLPKETQKAYDDRMQRKRSRYDQGTEALARGDYLSAAQIFDELANDREVPEGYLNLEALRSETREKLAQEAKKSLADAQAAEARGDFDAAEKGYRRAHALDASISIEKNLQALNTRRVQVGEELCNRARARWTFARFDEARQLYKSVLKALPETHACYKEALERAGR